MKRIYNRSDQKEKRKILRQNMTEAEIVLWNALRTSDLINCKFVRRYSIESFVVDFYCRRLKIAIEVDGSVHEDLSAKAYDAQRTRILCRYGIKVVRFTNDQVLQSIGAVIDTIKHLILPLLREGGSEDPETVELTEG